MRHTPSNEVKVMQRLYSQECLTCGATRGVSVGNRSERKMPWRAKNGDRQPNCKGAEA